MVMTIDIRCLKHVFNPFVMSYMDPIGKCVLRDAVHFLYKPLYAINNKHEFIAPIVVSYTREECHCKKTEKFLFGFIPSLLVIQGGNELMN